MTKGVLDISIKAFNKVIKTEKDLLKFLTTDQVVEFKEDGVKVQLYLKPDADSKKPFYENWLVAYKGNIIYPTEFEYTDEDQAKQSIGISQYMFIWKHLESVNINQLPKGTQFFCEYLLKKPTLMSNYTKLYQLVLLAYNKCNCYDKNGRMICDNNQFNYDREERKRFAAILGINTPIEVIDGPLYPYNELINSIVYNPFLQAIQKTNLKDIEDINDYWNLLAKTLLGLEDPFGGKPEGFVFWNDIFPPVKVQQDYQLDKEARAQVKAQYKGSPTEELIYWNKIQLLAEEIISKLNLKKDIKTLLKEAGQLVKKAKLPVHSKKNEATIRDDLFLTIKLKLIRELAEKSAMIIGKFRVFTNGHKKLIDKALKKYKHICLVVVDNKETKQYKNIRMQVLERCLDKYIKEDKLTIISARTGFIPTLINKCIPNVIGAIFAGSDRIPDYQEQINKIGQDIKVIELQRDENAISATKVLNNIDDEKFFKNNTPKCVWPFYKNYKNLPS